MATTTEPVVSNKQKQIIDKAVVRFYVNLDVENAFIFDRQLPVTGQVILRYDLYDIGVVPNITVPFGC